MLADPAGLPSFLVHNRTIHKTLPSSGLKEKREFLFKNTLPTFSTEPLSPRELQLSQDLYSDSTFFFLFLDTLRNKSHSCASKMGNISQKVELLVWPGGTGLSSQLLRKLSKEAHKFKACLDNLARPCLKNKMDH